MRLHELTVTAFGPFAGTEHVDFDELNDAGLFLLTGPTGAGKSSLLDAVCFALYGTVPGARGTKTLKSQHAAVQAPPEVVLDFSVRDRRFVVRRSPEWTRPKKRGEGLITEKAGASITETTTGVDHFLSSRAAEVGLLVTDLMGMNAAQFEQVALLPQGEFQTFLRASSQERHDVLQHLFRTDRFARIEEWVHEHSRDLKARAGAGESDVRRILDSIADRSGTPTPEDLADEALAPAAAEGRVLPWAESVLAEAERAQAEGATRHQAAVAAVDEARARHADAARRLQSLARREEAERTLTTLDESATEASASRERLADDQRASRCVALLDLLDHATAAHADALVAQNDALLSVQGAGLDAPLTSVNLAALFDEARIRFAAATALLPREKAAQAAQLALARDQARLVESERDLSEATRRAKQIPTELAAATSQLTLAAVRAGRAEALALDLASARDRHAAADELATLHAALADLEDAHRDARDRAADARDRVQALAVLRLAGMAAELAGGLTAGSPCQVCGSTDHPHPAEPADDAVTELDQQDAERAHAQAAVARDAAAQAVHDAQRRRDALVVRTGGLDVEQSRELVGRLIQELAEAVTAEEERSSLDQTVTRLRAEEQEVVERRARTEGQVLSLRQAIDAHAETIATVSAEVETVTGPGVTVRDILDQLARAIERLSRAQRASAAADQAAARVEELRHQALSTVSEQGFADLAHARAAALPADERRQLEQQQDDRASTEARARAVLEDPEIASLETDADDLAESTTRLAAGLAAAEETVADTARGLHLHDELVRALRVHLTRLRSTMTAWAPVRDDSLRAESMSRLVRGMGHDNQLQMRLSAYVLATRLDQVVDAANERLGHMRDQRYLLQRTGRAARKGSQAGLGLEIVDQWTGDVRDPATLSGGETFVVSLSLALGLADVVTQESGGTEIETLFVDEGFGTLDADTLDDVMDRLDGLRAGGRTVGVVSHVSELRNRIPTQVHVEKGRSGSTITVHTLVG